MDKKRNVEDDTPINYWRSASDLLMGLLLVLFLLLLVFMYRSVGVDEPGTHFDEEPLEKESEVQSVSTSNGGGVSGGGTQVQEDYEEVVDEDGKIRAAIKIIAKDLDTDKVIQIEDLEYEVYSSQNHKMVLSTYYPDVERFYSYLTMEDGTLFLPEKITEGSYRVESLNAPPGYESAEAVRFTIDRDYDWKDPYVVTMYYGMLRNEIRIRTVDYDTEETISGASYDVFSTVDIIGADGEILYSKDQVVDRIHCSANGVGQSKELVVGDYYLKPVNIPSGYAVPLEPLMIQLGMKTEENLVEEVELVQTRMTVTVVDELTNTPLVGAKFRMSDGKNTQVLVSDEKGEFQLSELKRDGAYTLIQESAPASYQKSEEEIPFAVDESGYIDGEAQVQKNVTNRIIRAEFGAEEYLSRKMITGLTARLKNTSGETVAEWTTNGEVYQMEGLSPGEYVFEIDGQMVSSKNVVIEDVARIQSVRITAISNRDIVIVVCIGIALVSVLIFFVWMRRKKRKNLSE